MEPDDADDGDDELQPPLLPPDDRLWRHPSEVSVHGLPPEIGSADAAPPSARVWPVAVLAGLIGALLTLGVVGATGGLRDRVRTVRSVERLVLPAASWPASADAARAGSAAIVDRLRPAIVGLEVEGGEWTRQGSGVLFRSDGHLVTNHHVVSGARRITVVLDGGERLPGHLVGADPSTDVAVVRIARTDLPTAPLGSAAALEVGQGVLVVGSPLDQAGGAVVVAGMVSALARQVEREPDPALTDMIQTDAAVPAASSGGALVDGRGAVVGLATAAGRVPGVSRLGFATPIDYARSVADQLVDTGKVVRVWIGVEGDDLDPVTADGLGLNGGAIVHEVREGSPAGRAGLGPGDVITSVDDVPVLSMVSLRILLRAHRPGETVTVALRRGSSIRTAQVRLAERPQS